MHLSKSLLTSHTNTEIKNRKKREVNIPHDQIEMAEMPISESANPCISYLEETINIPEEDISISVTLEHQDSNSPAILQSSLSIDSNENQSNNQLCCSFIKESRLYNIIYDRFNIFLKHPLACAFLGMITGIMSLPLFFLFMRFMAMIYNICHPCN